MFILYMHTFTHINLHKKKILKKMFIISSKHTHTYNLCTFLDPLKHNQINLVN